MVYYTGMPVVYDSIRLSSEQIIEDVPYADFGEADPIGEAMTFDFGNTKYTFEVAGVAEKFPVKRSSLHLLKIA